MLFDARAAKLLQPGQHLVVDGAPGLRLEASVSRKAWTYRFKDVATGRMKQAKIGEWPAMPVAVAVGQWQALREARAAGDDPRALRKRSAGTVGQTDKPAAAGEYLVRELVADFITGHLDARKSDSKVAAERALLRLLEEAPDLASRTAASVSRSDAFQVLDARKEFPTAAARLRSLLSSAWTYAHDAGRLPDNVPNWWREVMRGRLKSKGKVIGGQHVGPTRRMLRLEDVGTLLAWSAQHMHQLAQDTLVLYLWTCTRGSEILSMRPEHLAEERTGWWWTIPKALTKNADNPNAVDLRVPLIGRARDVVLRRLESVGQSGWLFEDARGEQYTQHDFSTYIYDLQPYSSKAKRAAEHGGEAARARLPVTGWTPHNLRRTSRTLLAGLGCPREVAEAILGHLPGVIEATYNCYSYDAERLVWLGRLSESLEASAVAAGLPARP